MASDLETPASGWLVIDDTIVESMSGPCCETRACEYLLYMLARGRHYPDARVYGVDGLLWSRKPVRMTITSCDCACDCYSPFHHASCRPCGSCVLLAQEIEHVSIEYSVRLSGSQNAREHWATRSKRVKAERMGARLRLAAAGNPPPGDWLVVLTRVGPRELDDDNLAAAFKATRDGVADYLGIDDGNKRIQWVYGQRRGAYAVQITIATYNS